MDTVILPSCSGVLSYVNRTNRHVNQCKVEETKIDRHNGHPSPPSSDGPESPLAHDKANEVGRVQSLRNRHTALQLHNLEQSCRRVTFGVTPERWRYLKFELIACGFTMSEQV
jgi:hypothetical protein